MKWHISLILAASALVMLAGCTAPEAEIDNTTIDFAQSVYKHITNGGVHDDPDLPYNVDAITGATLTVEGPGVVTSIPLSVRELENRSDGLFRGIYEDSTGRFIYEGVDLYYMLHEMTSGENGILLTDSAYKVQLKDSSRALAAELTLEEITAAHQAGRPILIAYGIGTPDGETAAPFVFDANAEGEHSLGYIETLDNEDGCLRLVYDLENYGLENDYDTFSNVAYIYLCEESEPGFKHTDSADPAYSSPEYTDYIVTFRGQALGAEIDLTVAQLEALVHTLPDGTLPESGIGYRSEYSLANNAYWYVNEYEGLDLYQLLCYLGMNTVEEMGRAAARTTLVTFNAADGRQSPESFSVEVLSYPDAFGFYEKNAADQGDGSYVPSNADLVNTGYPVLLAYGVNRYPYTVDRGDPGYLSGLANSGGPLRVVFGKTQYNHANGSNQVQYLSEVIVGEDRLYNTHLETADPALAALAEETLTITVNGTRGERLTDLTLTVGEVEQLVYGADPAPRDREAAKVKQRYVLSGGESAILEGVDLYHLLMETVAIPGTVGTATFSNGTDDITIALEELFTDGANPDGGLSGLPAILAFAKNGAPLTGSADGPGYVESIPLSPLTEADPASYHVDNAGGPLMLVLPESNGAGARTLEGVTSITVDIQPDRYSHIESGDTALSERTVRFFGPGLEGEAVYTVAQLERRQTQAVTLDYSMSSGDGVLVQERYRGVPLQALLAEIGLRSNAGDVTITSADGTLVTVPLARLRGNQFVNYAAPEKRPLCAILAYGQGTVDGDAAQGVPLAVGAGGPLKLIVPMGDEGDDNRSLCLDEVVSVEVSANEIDTWGHAISDVYSEFLDDEMVLTLRNEDHEWSHAFTVGQLESLEELVVRADYDVLELGTCEGIDLWEFVKLVAGDAPGLDNPVSVTAYASDGYKNDLLSLFYLDGLERGVPNADGELRPLIIAYAFNGVPLVDSADHEGYTGLAGNTDGPLRIVAEGVQGASVKYFNQLVVTLPGSGPLELTVDESLFGTG